MTCVAFLCFRKDGGYTNIGNTLDMQHLSLQYLQSFFFCCISYHSWVRCELHSNVIAVTSNMICIACEGDNLRLISIIHFCIPHEVDNFLLWLIPEQRKEYRPLLTREVQPQGIQTHRSHLEQLEKAPHPPHVRVVTQKAKQHLLCHGKLMVWESNYLPSLL